MPYKRHGTRARWIRLAIFIAFVAQSVAVYTTLPGAVKVGFVLPLTQQEVMIISAGGLACIVGAYIALKIFIARRIKFETLLCKSQAFARSAFDAVPAQIAIVNRSGVIVSINESWLNAARENGGEHSKMGEGTNYLAECDRAAGRGCQEAATIGHALREILNNSGGSFVLEYTAHTPNRRRWFQVRISPFKGKPVGAVIAHEDISDRKLADERHENAKREAEAANAAKSAFIANISHEIRTPMNAILGYADMLLNANSTQDERHDCVKVIRRNGEHLLAIINDILDISKVEACRMSAERIACDLPQLIADVIGLTRPKAIEKRLKFEVTFDEVIPKTIQTDPVRAKQVLVNLVGNAIKFTASGTVKVHVSREISYFGHTIRFDVSDTGIGVTAEQMTKLFQPFSQADVSTTRKFGGTGLGLTISKRLAQVLGGDIAVESKEGVGSTFSFTLDGGSREGVELLNHFTQSQLDVSELSSALEGKEIRLQGNVLLAEDGEDNQHVLITFLEQAGVTVTLACNGEAAVQLALSREFDLVLMDMQMPVMDGYRAAGELRKAGFTKPIVALTAHAMAEDRVKCLAAGCTEYLSKPIDRQKLLMTCSNYLRADIYPFKPADEQRQSIKSEIFNLKSQLELAGIEPPAKPEVEHSHESVEETMQSLRSNLANDPRVMRVLDRFISNLPDRVTELQNCLNDGNLDLLRHAIHNLKGAGSGYGFPAITQKSASAEEALKAQRSLDEIRREVGQLIGLIQRVDGYDPGAGEREIESRTQEEFAL